ncbi:winged helix-turn-helix transcriptional regulator [Pseudoruegeria sp. SHC-113]|uniref:winged helix-turn-helix transcriptional regulator n=1 Tax=Pseudoruegeria sp. SHC-113 TaxID=2855439 RepID=UPI0021BACB3C|nr:helix-turn-helix domain-containing protein [Pseudoruegeria sp. SHC-113]MCT8162059.1 helix-turn-helix transcriptional regulator [Pseudoruegeria sp. SHC-113]
MNPLPQPQESACATRDILRRITDGWSLLILIELSKEKKRFNRLRDAISGISQRMLSVSLRHLERDGLVSRTVLPSSPPQVEYALTSLGQSLVPSLKPLQVWAEDRQPDIHAARDKYDRTRLTA